MGAFIGCVLVAVVLFQIHENFIEAQARERMEFNEYLVRIALALEAIARKQ